LKGSNFVTNFLCRCGRLAVRQSS